MIQMIFHLVPNLFIFFREKLLYLPRCLAAAIVAPAGRAKDIHELVAYAGRVLHILPDVFKFMKYDVVNAT